MFISRILRIFHGLGREQTKVLEDNTARFRVKDVPAKDRFHVNFYLSHDKHEALLHACGKVDCSKTDFFNAALDLCIPMAMSHPELFSSILGRDPRGQT